MIPSTKKTYAATCCVPVTHALARKKLEELESFLDDGWEIITCVCSGSGDHCDTLIYTLTKHTWLPE